MPRRTTRRAPAPSSSAPTFAVHWRLTPVATHGILSCLRTRRTDQYEQVRPALARLLGRVLVSGAVLVVESAAGTTAGLPWTVVREKRYGDTRVTFLVAGAASAAEGESAG